VATTGEVETALATIVVVVASHLRQGVHTSRKVRQLQHTVAKLTRVVATLSDRVDRWSHLP
jgi:hypothetical protein